MVVDGLYKKKKTAASTPLVVRIKSKTRNKRADFLLLIKSTVSYIMLKIVPQKIYFYLNCFVLQKFIRSFCVSGI